MADEPAVKKKAKPGWYDHPAKDGFERLWDGDGWTDETRLKSEKVGTVTGGGLIAFGIFLAVFTGALAYALLDGDQDLEGTGFIVLGVGGLASQVALLIGIIAKGVEIGNRAGG